MMKLNVNDLNKIYSNTYDQQVLIKELSEKTKDKSPLYYKIDTKSKIKCSFTDCKKFSSYNDTITNTTKCWYHAYLHQ
jgi:hypothetical protein